MEHYTKKNRIYITSKTYLKKVKRFCMFIATIGALSCGWVFYDQGITFTSLGVMAGIGLLSLIAIQFFWKNARAVSLKSGNIILKTMGDRNVVAPIGSVRVAKSSDFFGLQLTRIRYKIDGGLSRFFVVTKRQELTPEQIIKGEIAELRKKKIVSKQEKKEANHKPDSVLTQTA